MSRASNALGYRGERIVLAELNKQAAARGWGIAVPLSPNYPADILDLRPSGPVFVEVKTLTHPTRAPRVSASERALEAQAREAGARMILAVVRTGPGRGAPYSLSYSPMPGTRIRPKRHLAPLGPPSEPSNVPGSGLGTALRSGGTAGGMIEGATSEPASSTSPQGQEER